MAEERVVSCADVDDDGVLKSYFNVDLAMAIRSAENDFMPVELGGSF